MDSIQSLILGIVEGITEFLPISSTGHLILTSHLLKIQQDDFLKSFEITIQLGAMLSVVFLYWRRFFLQFSIIKRLIAAFIPTGVVGLLFYRLIKNYLLESNTVVLLALFIGGLLLIVFELLYKEKETAISELEKISYKHSFLIGLAQSVAIIPGVSRSAATIIGGLAMNLKRKTIVEFSFLLAVPTMLAATGLDLLKNYETFSVSQIDVLILGFITSFVVALLSIKGLLYFIKKSNFIGFGIYRIFIAVIFWLVFI